MPWICLLKNRNLCSAYKADNSTSWEQGRYATKVLSIEEEPVLKQVIPVYLNAFCSLLSPNIICIKRYQKRNQHFIILSSICMSWKFQLLSSNLSYSLYTRNESLAQKQIIVTSPLVAQNFKVTRRGLLK